MSAVLQIRDKKERDPKAARAIVQGGNIIELALSHAGAEGHWLARPEFKTTIKGHRVFKARHYIKERHCIVCVTKPGDNGTAWEWNVIGPTGTPPEVMHGILFRMSRFEMSDVAPEIVEIEPDEQPTVIEPVHTFIENEEIDGGRIVFPERPVVAGSQVIQKAERKAVENGQIVGDDQPLVEKRLGPNDLIRLTARFGQIAQRAQERDRQIIALAKKKVEEENGIEKLMAELQSTEQLIVQLAAERDNDTEAQKALQALSLLNDLEVQL